MKKAGKRSQEDFALYQVLVAHNCQITVPCPNADKIDLDKIFKEAINALEGWAHDYNNTHDNILEFLQIKKLDFFACDANKVRKFFSEFLTALLHGPDDADWRMLGNIFGTTCSKRCIKFLWTTRFNLLTFIDKKVFLYHPFKKIWLTVEQCINISPKFFTKDSAKTMENFQPRLNGLSSKVRNKDMVCVSDWYELLFDQYCMDNPYSIKQYTTKGVENSQASFMMRCLGDLNFEGTKKGKGADSVINEKRANETKYPTDSRPPAYSVYSQNQEVKSILGKKSTMDKRGSPNGRVSIKEEAEEVSSNMRKSMAANTYARSTLKKHEQAAQSSKKPSSFSGFFESVPKQFQKSFREHESFSRRALNLETKLQRKYDLEPEKDLINNAFKNCKMQKNKGLIEQMYLE